MMRIILLLFLFTLANRPEIAFSQNLTKEQAECYTQKCRQLGMNPNFAFQHRINVAGYKKLKKNGIDLQQMARRWGGFTPLEQVLLVPTVVKVEVVGAEEAPANRNGFLMMYLVEVSETISGDKLPKRIELYSRSAARGNQFFGFNNEPVLNMGEEAILFLNRVPLNAPYQKKPAEPLYEQISLKLQEEEHQVYTTAYKYTVQNGKLLDSWNRVLGEEKDFHKKAKKISKLNRPDKFFSRSYCKSF